jgi:hypothetical protein
MMRSEKLLRISNLKLLLLLFATTMLVVTACTADRKYLESTVPKPNQPVESGLAYRVASRATLLSPPPSIQITKIPRRSIRALSGSDFLKSTNRLSLAQRERRIEQELLAGNIPNYQRQLLPVPIDLIGEGMVFKTGWIFAMPDYISIGSDRDFVRIPMTPATARKVADKFGLFVPTSAMVNAVYEAANSQLKPRPLPPHLAMRSNQYFFHHEKTLREQIGTIPANAIIAGHKKDLVISARQRPDRVTIYGWHQAVGEPIQPVSIIHHASYSDYSHGLRLFAPVVIIDGRSWKLAEALRHPSLSTMLSSEGRIRIAQLPNRSNKWSKEELRTPYTWPGKSPIKSPFSKGRS